MQSFATRSREQSLEEREHAITVAAFLKGLEGQPLKRLLESSPEMPDGSQVSITLIPISPSSQRHALTLMRERNGRPEILAVPDEVVLSLRSPSEEGLRILGTRSHYDRSIEFAPPRGNGGAPHFDSDLRLEVTLSAALQVALLQRRLHPELANVPLNRLRNAGLEIRNERMVGDEVHFEMEGLRLDQHGLCDARIRPEHLLVAFLDSKGNGLSADCAQFAVADGRVGPRYYLRVALPLYQRDSVFVTLEIDDAATIEQIEPRLEEARFSPTVARKARQAGSTPR